jgi:transmembrane sensor
VASDSDRTSTEAAIWLARIERGLQPQDGPQLREWLRQPAQRDVIVEAAKLWHGPDIVAVLAELVPVGFGTPLTPKKKRIHPVALGFGVCLALLIAAPFLIGSRLMRSAFTTHYRPGQTTPWGQTVYTTRPGETRAVTLQDGSKVTLNAHTQLGVLFAAGLRQAKLQYGEAIFRIAPELRAFQVNAGGRHFEAPPSMFDIRVINPQEVELMVLEGGVTVQGLPWHWPSTPAEARMFDPDVFVDTTVGPLQTALLQDQLISRNPITAANAHARLRWQPEDVIYVTP